MGRTTATGHSLRSPERDCTQKCTSPSRWWRWPRGPSCWGRQSTASTGNAHRYGCERSGSVVSLLLTVSSMRREVGLPYWYYCLGYLQISRWWVQYMSLAWCRSTTESLVRLPFFDRNEWIQHLLIGLRWDEKCWEMDFSDFFWGWDGFFGGFWWIRS